jgi:uncharacterized protein (DUF2141 family)
MKKMTSIIVLLCLFATYISASEWIITISGIKHEKEGNLFLAIYPGEDAYMNPSKIIGEDSQPVSSDTMQFVVKDQPPGEYCFAIFHDENGDSELNRGAMLPKEGFAFSGSKQPATRPPKYKNAYVTLDSELVKSSAQMKYY